MSRKVSHRSSITNRPTCGGPIKAGLAPRSTNFMMGVKRNHHFSGKPFAGKAADYPPECRGGDSNGGGSSSGGGGNGLTLGAGHSSGLSCDGMYEDCRFVKWTGRGIDPRYKYKGYKTSCNDWCKECCDKSWGCKKAYCARTATGLIRTSRTRRTHPQWSASLVAQVDAKVVRTCRRRTRRPATTTSASSSATSITPARTCASKT